MLAVELDLNPGDIYSHFFCLQLGQFFPASNNSVLRMNRVTQFVSFTSIMSVSMVCLAVTLLLLAQGTQHPVAVQVTF